MTNRSTSWIKGIILAGLALMFAVKINTGTLNFYINQRFAWLALVAVLLFSALALTVVFRLMDRAAQSSPLWPGHGRINVFGAGLLVLPIVFGLLVPARPLGASALAGRGLGLGAPVRAGSAPVAQRSGGQRSIIDWLIDISRSPDPAALSGQAVDVIGFVYHDPRVKPNQFFVSRFAVSCCVADATPVALLVETADASALKTDAWVRVVGRFSLGEYAGQQLPIIAAERIEATQAPNQPYLFP
ncbi:MAG TPA: TIGR03943 family protein [Thermoflexales bacterium]|jgi:uncharacterized repeat protein (TIGR03943 family)|nr:TIGR03943 family protein [Anaerolineae bacterium]HQV28193.1 TIGR03943 family protein [Thermoflexales bacterium]HQX10907.1 TIGR03943 family protein [Thermoflexales bacterium]HQY25921.1 TIGR03943 family protein [Thermoflexales bacterium]HQZ53593.1 TIGR03943 family protein [Thermoflexales bacterium]